MPSAPSTAEVEPDRGGAPARSENRPAPSQESQAASNLRRHLIKSTLRLVVLMTLDLTALWGGREVLRFARAGRLGGLVDAWSTGLFPPEAVYGLELAVAVLLALMGMGTYRTGDYWRDPVRILGAVGLGVGLALYRDLFAQDVVLVLVRGLIIWAVLGLCLVSLRRGVAAVTGRIPRRRLQHRVLHIRGDTSPGDVHEVAARFRIVTEVEATQLPPDVASMGPWLEGGVDTVLVTGDLSPEAFGQVLDFALAHGCRLYTLPRTNQLMGVDPQRIWIGGTPYIQLTAPTLRASHLVFKRVLDVLGSGLLLVVLSPVMLALALLVKLDSPGPVFFRHRRAGVGGRYFSVFKFRSMHVDAESMLARDSELHRLYLANDFKLPDGSDPRVTRLGRVLRRTSLDELPQLLNVLRGEMSLVGPRPVVEPELEMYGGQVPTFLSVRPGLTGLWQISGRSGVAFPRRAELDLEYVRTWSLLGDLWILLLTIPAVLLRRGAH